MPKFKTSTGLILVLFLAGGLLVIQWMQADGDRYAGLEKISTDLNLTNFVSEVGEAQGLVVVDFTAAWCGPCRRLAPMYEALAHEFSGRIKFCRLDVDQNQTIASAFVAEGLPCVWIFEDGKAKEYRTGLRSKRYYEKWFQGYLDDPE